jgi:hypothetical protein
MRADTGFLHYPFARCACCPADPLGRILDPRGTFDAQPEQIDLRRVKDGTASEADRALLSVLGISYDGKP